jgi:hypothetical protein
LKDSDVPGWWSRLGLPGLADVHVHFLPDAVMNAVWRYFDDAETHYRVAWPVAYRISETERIDTLRALGIRTFSALVYPHKPGMAESLSGWARVRGPDARLRPERHVLRRAFRGTLRPRSPGSRHPGVQDPSAGR